MEHKSQYRVYYEDTDAGGVVYYANYLKFAERARTELLRDCDINQNQLIADSRLFFVVRHASLNLLKPARLDDLLTVTTSIKHLGGASITMEQYISTNEQICAHIEVRVACVNADFVPTRLPLAIKSALQVSVSSSTSAECCVATLGVQIGDPAQSFCDCKSQS